MIDGANIPAPGSGCHPAILGEANRLAWAGKSAPEIFSEIRRSIPEGNRHVPDSEIEEAVDKALRECQSTVPPAIPQRPKVLLKDGTAARNRIIRQARISEEVDIWEASPIRLDWLPEEDTARFLFFMFRQTDLIFIGNRYEAGVLGINIRTVKDWITYFNNGGQTGPHICINPLSGKEGQTKSRKTTYRGDNCISKFRYCLVEFDDVSREDQLRFWCAARLPISALVDSGGKSIHAWLDLNLLENIHTPEDWNEQIRINLYAGLLEPMGADSANKNPSRLSRLPGHERTPGTYQRLLWLSPKGRRIDNGN